MQWTLSELAAATGGHTDSDAEISVDGVGIDTRTLQAGQLWVAVHGERDGHDFVPAAVEAGAGALLVERTTGAKRPEIVVADTAAALLDLGRAARRRLRAATVIGITGSVGKTSTKDLVAGAIAQSKRSVASPGSFNNELGLPLTLANAPGDAEVVVLEMGARGPGHIALLCDVGRPTIGIVTAVAAAHVEMFGDLDGVAVAKGELVEALPASGTAVLNGDDPRTRAMSSRTQANVLLYSAAGDAEVRAAHVTLDADLRPTFEAHTPWGTVTVALEARGAHQVGNALAALAAAAAAGVPLEEAAAGMRAAARSPHRMDVRQTAAGATVINDSYNANPASMRAGLDALAALPNPRKIAVLGLMAELGPETTSEHRAIADLARSRGVELIAVGTDEYGVPDHEADEVPELIGALDRSTAILIKASRVAALERVATRLLQSDS